MKLRYSCNKTWCDYKYSIVSFKRYLGCFVKNLKLQKNRRCYKFKLLNYARGVKVLSLTWNYFCESIEGGYVLTDESVSNNIYCFIFYIELSWEYLINLYLGAHLYQLTFLPCFFFMFRSSNPRPPWPGSCHHLRSSHNNKLGNVEPKRSRHKWLGFVAIITYKLSF